MFERDVRGHVLDEQPDPERVLGLRDLAREQLDRFLGVRQRQQVIEEFAAGVPQQACSDTSAGSKRAIARLTRARCSRSTPSAEPSPKPTPCRLSG